MFDCVFFVVLDCSNHNLLKGEKDMFKQFNSKNLILAALVLVLIVTGCAVTYCYSKTCHCTSCHRRSGCC